MMEYPQSEGHTKVIDSSSWAGYPNNPTLGLFQELSLITSQETLRHHLSIALEHELKWMKQSVHNLLPGTPHLSSFMSKVASSGPGHT